MRWDLWDFDWAMQVYEPSWQQKTGTKRVVVLFSVSGAGVSTAEEEFVSVDKTAG
jgi:hypothetical protein